jgi:flagellar biosynthesis protein FliQ
MPAFIFSNFLIQSNKDNHIAFELSIGLLVKVFGAAEAIEAEAMQVCYVPKLFKDILHLIITAFF